MPRNLTGSTRKRPRHRNKDMIFGTWNIQGLNKKLEDVIKGVQLMKIDIAVLTETKKKGKGVEQLSDYVHIYSGVPKNNRACRGVSILINRKYINKLHNWDTINERIAVANLTLKGHRVSIIGAYGPNEDAPQVEKDEFYNLLDHTITHLGNQREIVLLGDLNARVGISDDSEIVGRYGEINLNDNGIKLVEICEQHKLKILNGFFNHKDIHKYTWHQDTRGLKTIIDYIITKQDTKWVVRDTRVYRGVECGTDHYLLMAKIWISINKPTHDANDGPQENNIKQKQYNLNSLYNSSTRSLFQDRLNQKLNDNYLTSETPTLYQHIMESMQSAAYESLGSLDKYLNTNKNNVTWNTELENQKNIKQQAYKRWLNTKNIDDQMTYKREQARFKNIINRNRNETWDNKCKELNCYIGGSRSTEAWKLIRSLRRETTNKINIQPIQMDQWQQHYVKELNEDREQYLINSPKPYNIQGQHIEVTDVMIERAIRSMKNKKAPGPEGLPAELLKNGTNKLNKYLKELFTRYVNGEEIPLSWKEAWITPIHKKGRKDECSNYRCISVTSTMSRLYGKLIRNIIEQEYGPYEIEEQTGFRTGRSCVDHIFSLTQINEKKVATNRDVHLLFVDLTKAYDTIPVQKLWQVLEKSPINNTVITAVKQLYDQATSRIKLGNKLSENFLVTKGLRQGCCLSPTLFKIYLNEALKRWRRACGGMGIQLNDDKTLYTLHFADDQVVVASDKEDLEFMTSRLFKEYEEWGLEVNRTKTKYMCIGHESQNLQVGDNQTIGICKNYVYLGTQIDSTGRTENEIQQRILKGKRVVGCLNSILWSKSISREKKHLLYNAIFKSIVLYGCETWQLNKNLEKRLLALEMDYWRRSAGKSRIERMTNDRIREIMKVETTIIEEIQRRQLIWYGHVKRMDEERLPKIILNWTPTERRRRGRPRTTWMGGIQKAMSERNLQPGDWNDRRGWKLGTGRRRTL